MEAVETVRVEGVSEYGVVIEDSEAENPVYGEGPVYYYEIWSEDGTLLCSQGDYVDPDEAAREAEVDLMNATKESKMAKSEGEYAIYGFAADGEAVFVNQHPGENEAIQEAEGHARFNAMRYVVALVDIKGDDFLLDHDRIVFDTEEATAKPKRVIVEVSDGVAEVTYADEGVEVTVHDHDSEKDDPAGFTQWTATGPLDLEGRVDWRAAGRER